MEILPELNQVFVRVLGRPDLVLRSDMLAKDIPEWDSLAHLELIAMAEKHFRLKFTLQEMQAIKGVPDFLRLIEPKLAGRPDVRAQ